jgi:hypothetical protein
MNLGRGIDPITPEAHADFFIQTVQNYNSQSDTILLLLPMAYNG